MPEYLKIFINFKLLYVLIAGLFFYLLTVTIDLIFIPKLEMPEAWCEKWVETRSGFRSQQECVQFSDTIQELKYRHNQKMETRYTNKMFGIFLGATLITFLMMLINPHRFFDQKITFDTYTGTIAVAVFYGTIIGFLLPITFQAVFPSPSEWFPNEFFEIQKARTELILRQISEAAGQPN